MSADAESQQLEQPSEGGSYVRQPDGSLVRAPGEPEPAIAAPAGKPAVRKKGN